MENNAVKEMTKGKIRAAVVGCGHLGSYHAQKYSALGEEVELVAVCDLFIDKAKALVSKLESESSCVALSNWRDLVDLNIN